MTSKGAEVETPYPHEGLNQFQVPEDVREKIDSLKTKVKGEFPPNKTINQPEEWERIVELMQECGLDPVIYRGYGSLEHAESAHGFEYTTHPQAACDYAKIRAREHNSKTPAVLAINIPNLLSALKTLPPEEARYTSYPLNMSVEDVLRVNINPALTRRISLTQKPIGTIYKI